MASLPSGFREDVELVKIETEEIFLFIKGKPFHERYEGLTQYRSMDFHDTMKILVNSKDVHMFQVYDINKQHLVTNFEELRPIFFENGVYQLMVKSKGEKEISFYHEHPLLRKAISDIGDPTQTILMGNLQFQNEVGFTTFEIRSGQEILLSVTIEIFPTKLDYKEDYRKLLDEVNDEIYNLAYHFIRKTYLGASIKLDGAPSMAEFYRLISRHFHQFLVAVDRIEKQPHHLLHTEYVRARGDQIRKLDSRSRSYLRKRPTLFVKVENGIAVNNRSLMPTEGLRVKKEITHDTLENRFIKFIIVRLIDKLNDLCDRIFNQRKGMNEEPDSDLTNKIQKMIKQLDRKQKSVFWRQVGRLDRSVYSLVLQMAPGYREAYQIYLTISKGLTLHGKYYHMSVKDVATLYEYWTFLKMGQILSRKYTLLSQDIVKVNRDGLFVNLDSNRKAERVFQHPITKEKIILTYQKYEGKLPTLPQQPDMMLSVKKKGKDYSYHYIFDAKYRIDYARGWYAAEGSDSYITGPMEEDINTMHRYRDSIVMANNGPYERTAFGAYVLFPFGNEDIYQEHRFYNSIDKVNIGALPFLPNATTLVERFVERLINSSPEELQEEGILPRGSKEQWFSDLDEKVLVGLVSTKEDYYSFIKKGYYQIPVHLLKKGWQEAKYVALYAKNGVANVHGVSEYGEISNISFIKADDVEKVSFHVDYWQQLKQVIRPVHYGIANYVMTSLNLLKEAKEMPELFLKSKNELVLWRMLRRVSDQIKVMLDQNNLDEANKINTYSIKDINIELEKERQEIMFKKGEWESTLTVDTLEKQPSKVFKLLLDLMKD
ncbi:DUF2357 domain-containing protein [Niallia oryzisoli]|uniref:DUF2357 domain-containing protein n=1 Tax=Niallia oryzisoli TaxID=1737571 RepID=UPI0037350259